MNALLLGAGRMGAYHARVLSEDPLVDEVLVVDTHPERAEAVAARFGARAVGREDACPERLDAAWVVVATPTSVHDEAIRWAEAGSRVLVEKPLAADSGVARRLVHERVRVGHVERHNPAFRGLGLTGLHALSTRRLVDRAPSEEPGRDVVTDLLLHDLDLIAQHVRGLRFRSARGDPARRVVVEVEAEGFVATLEAGLVGRDDRLRSWQGHDAHGAFHLDLSAGRARRGERLLEGEGGGDALEAQWRAFRDGGGVPAEEGLDALRLAEEVLDRLRRGA